MPRTILVADDSSTIRRIVELTFSDSDIRVEAVSTGAAALERLDALRPDLVLADVVMPHPSGYEICRAVKSSARPVPVLLLAGAFESFDEARATDCGADDHLVKPFESLALRQKVEELLSSAARKAEGAAAATEEPEEYDLPPDEEEAAAQPIEAAEPEFDVVDAEEDLPAPDARLVDAVAREVVRKLSTDVLREMARDVVPELATRIIRERIRELESDD